VVRDLWTFFPCTLLDIRVLQELKVVLKISKAILLSCKISELWYPEIILTDKR